ncbi:MAG: lasso peptide biosynthesis B2 protein [Candidatus Tectomicrobia bacterium]|nr:lasso peptide biosynthesis B2 protein [Candidatus Tectomicrobia bacterium]
MGMTLARPKTIQNGWLALHAVGVMIALRLVLLRLKLPDLLQRLKPSRQPTYPDYPRLGKAAEYIEVLLRRYPFPLSGPCLPRALMRYYFAARCGLPVQFHCGVCHDSDRLEGHAWINVDGRPYREAVDPETIYAITFSFPKRPDRGTAVQAVDTHAAE